MDEGETLILPEPARQLWLSTRGAIDAGLQLLQNRPPEYTIGGGTILAARWRHRKSFDIDIEVDPETPLRHVTRGGDLSLHSQVRRLGGQGFFSAEIKKYKIVFDGSNIDIWAHRPAFAGAETEATVDGRGQRVLSTAQIIRGKLDRGDMNLVRDVFDIGKAREHDPESLETAINAIPRRTAENLAWAWHHGNPTLYHDAQTQLHGSTEAPIRMRDIGTRAATAIQQSLYREVEVDARPREIVVSTTTEGGIRRERRVREEDADDWFRIRGLNDHLDTTAPGADEVREQAKRAARHASAAVPVYREQAGRTVFLQSQSSR